MFPSHDPGGPTFAGNVNRSASPITPTINGKTIKYEYLTETIREAINVVNAGDRIFQIIIPRYEVDDIIYGGTGIAGGTATFDQSQEVIRWLDMNVDGRAWAETFEDPR